MKEHKSSIKNFMNTLQENFSHGAEVNTKRLEQETALRLSPARLKKRLGTNKPIGQYKRRNWIPQVFSKEVVIQLYNSIEGLPRRYCFEKENGAATDTRCADFIIERNQLIFRTQYYLALRPKEVCSLKWTDIIGQSDLLIRGDNNKTKKSRVMQIPEILKVQLWNYYKKYWSSKYFISEWMFPSLQGEGRTKLFPLSRYRWGEIFRQLVDLNGLNRVHPLDKRRCIYTPYALRHSRATHLLETSNFDLYFVSSFLGHSNIATTGTYLHLTDTLKARHRELASKDLPF